MDREYEAYIASGGFIWTTVEGAKVTFDLEENQYLGTQSGDFIDFTKKRPHVTVKTETNSYNGRLSLLKPTDKRAYVQVSEEDFNILIP
jgi:hypothetical protein